MDKKTIEKNIENADALYDKVNFADPMYKSSSEYHKLEKELNRIEKKYSETLDFLAASSRHQYDHLVRIATQFIILGLTGWMFLVGSNKVTDSCYLVAGLSTLVVTLILMFLSLYASAVFSDHLSKNLQNMFPYIGHLGQKEYIENPVKSENLHKSSNRRSLVVNILTILSMVFFLGTVVLNLILITLNFV